jgi:hypothetical protein
VFLGDNETLATYVSEISDGDVGSAIGNYDGTGGSLIFLDADGPLQRTNFYSQTSDFGPPTGTDSVSPTTGFYGVTRTSSTEFRWMSRNGVTENTQTISSVGLSTRDIHLFGRDDGAGGTTNHIPIRCSFVFAGGGLEPGGLVLLRNLVDTYVRDISGI